MSVVRTQKSVRGVWLRHRNVFTPEMYPYDIPRRCRVLDWIWYLFMSVHLGFGIGLIFTDEPVHGFIVYGIMAVNALWLLHNILDEVIGDAETVDLESGTRLDCSECHHQTGVCCWIAWLWYARWIYLAYCIAGICTNPGQGIHQTWLYAYLIGFGIYVWCYLMYLCCVGQLTRDWCIRYNLHYPPELDVIGPRCFDCNRSI